MSLIDFSPTVLLLVPALLILLLALMLFAAGRRARGLGRFLRAAVGVLLLLLALALGGLALVLHDYMHIADDVPVAHLTMKQLGPQRFRVEFTPVATGVPRSVELQGDQWEMNTSAVRAALVTNAAVQGARLVKGHHVRIR